MWHVLQTTNTIEEVMSQNRFFIISCAKEYVIRISESTAYKRNDYIREMKYKSHHLNDLPTNIDLLDLKKNKISKVLFHKQIIKHHFALHISAIHILL